MYDITLVFLANDPFRSPLMTKKDHQSAFLSTGGVQNVTVFLKVKMSTGLFETHIHVTTQTLTHTHTNAL